MGRVFFKLLLFDFLLDESFNLGSVEILEILHHFGKNIPQFELSVPFGKKFVEHQEIWDYILRILKSKVA